MAVTTEISFRSFLEKLKELLIRTRNRPAMTMPERIIFEQVVKRQFTQERGVSSLELFCMQILGAEHIDFNERGSADTKVTGFLKDYL